MIRRVLGWIGLALLAVVAALIVSSCTMLGMNYASLETTNKPAARPAIDVAGLVAGGAARAMLMQQFEAALYGPWPAGLAVSYGDWTLIDGDYLGGRGTLEERLITVGTGPGARSFHLVAAFPRALRPTPVVISQTFADNCSVFPRSEVTSDTGAVCAGTQMTGFTGWAATQIFGTYIAEAPVARYFDSGLAYASFYAGEFVPDSASSAPGVMASLGGPINPTSVLMAWGYGFSAALDALESDPRIDPARTAVMGHSRHGKSALIAGVWDRRVDAVIAHQSGFAGAALSRSATGEGLKRMAESYPHWLSPAVAPYLDDLESLPVDQHQLLALLAPTPVLLGNARRDVWSDPNSTYRAAEAASPVYAAFGQSGLPEGGMRTFDPAASIGWWLRIGGHSVVSEDIDAFTAFLAAHFELKAAADSPVTAAR